MDLVEVRRRYFDDVAVEYAAAERFRVRRLVRAVLAEAVAVAGADPELVAVLEPHAVVRGAEVSIKGPEGEELDPAEAVVLVKGGIRW